MEEVIVKFDLWGKFGHFKFPFTSPNHLKKTFNIIPRTTLLGILGSILGLRGYSPENSSDFEPEFFNLLKHIELCINLKEVFNTDIICYNSLNSFGNDAKKDAQDGGSNVIIKEEILIEPKYEVLLILNLKNDIDKKLFDIFQNSKNGDNLESNYHIYLGKNEFFANINNIEIFRDFKREMLDNLNFFCGIIPNKYMDEKFNVQNYVYDSFSSNVDFSNKKIRTNLVEVFYLIKKDKGANIELNDNYEFVKINQMYYYFWSNEVARNI